MSKHLYTLIIVFLGVWTNGIGQQGNPFDLNHRKSIIITDSVQEQSNTESNPFDKKQDAEIDGHSSLSGNPFDLTPLPKEKEISSPIRSSIQFRDYFIGEAQHFLDGKVMFWILMFMTLLLAIVVNLNRSLINNLLKAWTNPNFSNFLLRNKKGPDQVLYNLLSLLFYTNLCLFIVQGVHIYSGTPFSLKLTGWILLVVIATYLVRHSVLAVLSNLFSIKKEANQFSFTINIFNILLGLVLLVVNFILAYAPEGTGIFFIYLTVGIIGIQYLYRSFRGLIIGSSFLADSKMHFFLYLCTCEIAPLVIITFVLRNLG